MEQQKTPNSQSNLKKNKTGGIIIPDFKLYHKTVAIEPAQKRTHRSMEQNKEARNKPTIVWFTDLQQWRQEYIMGKSLFNKWCWENRTVTRKVMKQLLSYTETS